MAVQAEFKPGTIVRVRLSGHVLHDKFAIVDGMIDGMILKTPAGPVVLPRLVSVRGAQGDFTGEVFALLPKSLRTPAVPPVWAAKLRRQAYSLSSPLVPGRSAADGGAA